MKGVGTVLFIACSLFTIAQSPGNKFGLLINGKPYLDGDTINYSELSCLNGSIEVTDLNTQSRYSSISFECVVSIKDSNSVWKFEAKQLDIQPVHCKNCCKALGIKEVISLMHSNDIIAIDQIQYNNGDTTLPEHFILKVY